MKIAFVNQRYGVDVNGGSEYYTRLMAEHMSKHCEVEVLTTQAKDYITWKNEYTNGLEEINGVTVRRFPVTRERKLKKFRWLERFQRHIPNKITERLWLAEQGPYVPELIQYIKTNAGYYDLFVFTTYLYYTSVEGIPVVRDKAILIPTAHDEPYIYYDCYKKIFHDIQGFIYLTPEEKNLVQKIFHNEEVPNSVIGMGIDAPEIIKTSEFCNVHGIDGEYYIYAGRVDTAKGCGELFEYFSRYMEQNPKAQLVVIGKLCMKVPERQGIKVLGFVSDEEKYQAIAGAKALILPSPNESLSIAVLEAMKMGVPVIVNGACEVLKGHCIRSAGGGTYYTDYDEFVKCMEWAESSSREDVGRKGREYVAMNYDWETVEESFGKFLNTVIGKDC